MMVRQLNTHPWRVAPLLIAATLLATPGGATDAETAFATFAAGCFWCMEADFEKVEGVLSVTSGYTGGSVANPTYKQVSAGKTGHTEAVPSRDLLPRRRTTGGGGEVAGGARTDQALRQPDRHRDHCRHCLLSGQGAPPGLLQEEPDPLLVLPQELRAGSAIDRALGRKTLKSIVTTAVAVTACCALLASAQCATKNFRTSSPPSSTG